MGLTKEDLKIKINYKEQFTYRGKKLDTQSREFIENRIKEEIKDIVYQAIEFELNDGQEDLDYHNMDLNVYVE